MLRTIPENCDLVDDCFNIRTEDPYQDNQALISVDRHEVLVPEDLGGKHNVSIWLLKTIGDSLRIVILNAMLRHAMDGACLFYLYSSAR